MSLQLQYLHCRLIKVYNIKSGTKVNFVIYVLTWAPDIMQAHHYFSTLEKYMSGERRGEIKRSLGWECTPAIRALLLPDGEKQMMNPLWVVLPGTSGKKKGGEVGWRNQNLNPTPWMCPVWLMQSLRRPHFENFLYHCLNENYYKVVFKRQVKLFILITCFYWKCSLQRTRRSFL